MTRAIRQHGCATTRRGFTLVELLLALAIVSLIATASAAMLSTVIYATGDDHDTRRAMIQRQVAVTRLGALVRQSAMVLDQGPTHLVLWVGDTDRDGKPNLSELRRIQWLVVDEQIVVYESDPDSPPMPDTPYDLADNFDTITVANIGNGKMLATPVLGDVVAFQIALDDADAQQARVVEMAVTVRQNSGDDTAIVNAALRVDAP